MTGLDLDGDGTVAGEIDIKVHFTLQESDMKKNTILKKIEEEYKFLYIFCFCFVSHSYHS